MQKRIKIESQVASLPGSPSHSKKLLPIELPRPAVASGKSILKALQQRKTIREIRDKKLPLQLIISYIENILHVSICYVNNIYMSNIFASFIN